MGNGDYAFLGIELIKTRSSTSESSWYRPGDKRNKEAREMFESVLMIAVRVPTSVQYTSFVHDVVKKSQAEFGRGVSEADVSIRLSPLIHSLHRQMDREKRKNQRNNQSNNVSP